MMETVRLGLLRLCDAAPLIWAEREGIFAEHGVVARLFVEPSWANIADKLSYGLLDGAVMLPPLAMACAAGLRGRPTDLLVPMGLSGNGNQVTLARRWQADFDAGGIARVAAGRRPRLAVVHGFSTHDLLVRDWLEAGGVDPAHVDVTVLPPAEMVGSLAAGAIDGFCAGAPWGQVAVHASLGFVAAQSREIWPDHPEKCLAVRADYAARDAAGLRALLAALIAAGAACAAAAARERLAGFLAAPDFLDLPAGLIETALDPELGGPVFSRQYPAPAQAEWFATRMRRWGKAGDEILGILPGLYRPDLFLSAGGRNESAID